MSLKIYSTFLCLLIILVNSGDTQDLPDASQLLDVLDRSLDEGGNVNPSLLLKELIQDPIPVPDFNISSSDGLTDFDGRFKEMTVSGLRNLLVRSIHVNLGLANANVTLEAPALRMEGQYGLEGTVTFFSIDGSGQFWMNVTKVVAKGSASLKQNDQNLLQVDNVDLDVAVEGIQLHFESLMGSWSSITNTILNQLSEPIFEHVRVAILGDVKESVKNELNVRLAELPLQLVSSSESLFDDLLSGMAVRFRTDGIDPLVLPDLEESFSKRVSFLNVHGQARVYNGTLHGLSTISRTGDVIVSYQNDSLVLEARLGFANLTAHFGWNAHFMGIGPLGQMTVSLTRTSAYCRLVHELKRGGRPILSALSLEEIGQVWTDIQGLGTLDFLLEIVANLVVNSLKHSIGDALMGPMREKIQEQMDVLPRFI